VSTQDAESYAKEINAIFYEVSAKENTGIKELFERTALELHEKCPISTETKGDKK